MMSARRLNMSLGALTLTGTIVLAACATNSTDLVPLPPAAAEGRAVANKNGCAACHGTNGEGGVGPAFADLFGSIIELDDGSTVTADRDYVIESIKDPAAKRVAGFRLPMPTNRLTDDEIGQIVDYIEALTATPEETTQ
jgi:cytochrome c oxidase subunit 2